MSTATSTATQTYAIDAAHTGVEFSVRHLMISRVRGRFPGVQGHLTVAAGSDLPTAIDVTIDATSIDTREPQRDAHLKSADFFDVEKFPTLTFHGTRVEGTPDEFTVHGDLTIHGVTRPVELKATLEGKGADPWGGRRIAYEARTAINRKDFGLGWNQALETGGVVVGEEVRIELNVEAVQQA